MTPVLLAVLLTVAQDTSTIDRGVRIGIIYRPGVGRTRDVARTGMGLDSVRAMIARDLDYSDRFEVITLPGGDSIRLATSSSTRARGTGTRRSGAALPQTGRRPGRGTQLSALSGARRRLSHSTSRRRATRPSRRCTTSPRPAFAAPFASNCAAGDPDFARLCIGSPIRHSWLRWGPRHRGDAHPLS